MTIQRPPIARPPECVARSAPADRPTVNPPRERNISQTTAWTVTIVPGLNCRAAFSSGHKPRFMRRWIDSAAPKTVTLQPVDPAPAPHQSDDAPNDMLQPRRDGVFRPVSWAETQPPVSSWRWIGVWGEGQLKKRTGLERAFSFDGVSVRAG